MKKLEVILFVLFLQFGFLLGQTSTAEILEKDSVSDQEEDYLRSLFESGEEIDLGKVKLYRVKTETKEDKKYYWRLKYKLKKAYPLARETVLIYYNIKDSVSQIENKRARKKFLNKSHEELEEEFSRMLRGLTRWEGELYLKLVHRETGKTVKELIKELRGGVSAFMASSKAGLFSIDLDTRHEPDEIREDRFVEVILAKGIRKGIFEDILPGDKPKYKLGASEGE